MKTCPKCNLAKQNEGFNRDNNRKDGLSCYCRECTKKMQTDRYERVYGITQPLKKNRMLSTEDRFLKSYVVDGDCWIWKGTERGQNGYGGIKHDGKQWMAHRFSWQMHNGPIPDGKIVCHKCDTPKCVNPNHLFLGTQQDNMDDRGAKGRSASGDGLSESIKKGWKEKEYKNVRHKKLTEKQVVEIISSSLKNSELAKIYSVTRQCIYLIKTGKNWKWLTNNTTQT